MKTLFSLLTLLSLVSCGSDSSSGGGGNTLKSTFTDSTITNFEQMSNVAQNKSLKLQSILIPTAYAATGNISCVTGSDVDFRLTGLQATVVDVTAPCSTASAIDLKIRGKLLETLINKQMIREVTEQGKNTTAFSMPATAAGMASGVSIENNKGDTATWDFRNCFDLYQFDLDNGTITITNNGVEGAGANVGCNTNKGSGANTDYSVGFTATVKFRFKDGKLELNVDNETTFDPGTINGAGVPSNISYARWCIDDNTDGTCDI